MFEQLDLETVIEKIEKGYNFSFHEGSNNTTILHIWNLKNFYDITYSLKKEDVNSVKLALEIESKNYKVYPYEYLKYSKVLQKYSDKNHLWAFQIFLYEDENIIYFYDFKHNKIDRDHGYKDDILECAKLYGYTLHLNEKPGCWGTYSNGLN